jgi:hypothetical protein
MGLTNRILKFEMVLSGYTPRELSLRRVTYKSHLLNCLILEVVIKLSKTGSIISPEEMFANASSDASVQYFIYRIIGSPCDLHWHYFLSAVLPDNGLAPQVFQLVH